MAVTFTATDSQAAFAAASVVIPSQAWTNGVFYIVFLQEKVASGTPSLAGLTVAGATMTFQRVTSCDKVYDGSLASDSRSSVWVAVGNGNTETVTITCTEAQSAAWYEMDHFAGTKVTNAGLDAVRQGVVNSGAGANPSLSLAALQDAGSLAVGFFVTVAGEVVGAGFTQITHNNANPERITEYQTNVTTVNVTATANNWGGVAIELAGAAAAPVNTVAPAVTGTPAVGQTLACTTGTWTGT